MADRVGQQFGNYQLLRLLGEGGFAEVYLGKHVYLNNLAAIKLLHAHLVGKDAEHFLAEAKTLVDLMHPNIVRVLDFAVHECSPFLIMDYVASGTLRQQHPKGSCLPVDLVGLYIKQVASALQYAHDRQVIHRDVKPENMLLGKHQEVVLSDFGIATVVPRTGPLAKKDVVGTPPYMAPEQIDGHPVWDPTNLKTLFTYRGHTDRINSIMWSPPDGKYLASAAQDSTVQIWEAATGRNIFPSSEKAMIAANWSRDGKYVAIGYDEIIQVWEAASGDIVTVFARHEDTVLSTAWSPDGTLIASGSADGTMYIWDAATGDVRMAEKRKGVLQAVEWSFDGKVALGYKDGYLAIVDATSKRTTTPSLQKNQNVQALRWSPDNKHIAALDASGAVLLWDLTGGKVQLRQEYTGYISTSVAWSPDSTRVVSGGNDSTVQIWDATTGKTIVTYESDISSVQAIAWSPDGTSVASGGNSNELHVWSASTGSAAFTCSGPFSKIRSITWLQGGEHIAAEGDDDNIYLWDVKTGTILQTYGKSGSASAVTWSPRGSYLAIGDQKLTRVKKVLTATVTTAYLDSSRPVLSVSWSSDSKYIATGGESQRVRVWSAPTNELVAVYRHLSTVNVVAWSPQGKWLASGSDDKSVQIWELATRSIIFTYLEHSAAVNSLSWSPDGKHIASGSSDMAVRVWEAASGKLIFIYRGHTRRVNSVAWSPDGKHIAFASTDATVHVWGVDL